MNLSQVWVALPESFLVVCKLEWDHKALAVFLAHDADRHCIIFMPFYLSKTYSQCFEHLDSIEMFFEIGFGINLAITMANILSNI